MRHILYRLLCAIFALFLHIHMELHEEQIEMDYESGCKWADYCKSPMETEAWLDFKRWWEMDYESGSKCGRLLQKSNRNRSMTWLTRWWAIIRSLTYGICPQ